MLNILTELKEHKHDFIIALLKEATTYVYRNERYNTGFAVVAICGMDEVQIDFDEFKKTLRKTDKLVSVNERLFFIILDNIDAPKSIKVAENANYNLLKFNAKVEYCISVVSSENFNKNYSNMMYELFSRLEDALQNNLKNIVVYQDSVM